MSDPRSTRPDPSLREVPPHDREIPPRKFLVRDILWDQSVLIGAAIGFAVANALLWCRPEAEPLTLWILCSMTGYSVGGLFAARFSESYKGRRQGFTWLWAITAVAIGATAIRVVMES